MIQIDYTQNQEKPFLEPLEKPPNFKMKIAYFFTRRQFGKVITPLKVHSARLPFAFSQFYRQLPSLDNKLILPEETALLIRDYVSHLNVCLFCQDSNRWMTIKRKFNQEKFDKIIDYETNPLFTEKERILLDYVTELTQNKKVNQQTFNGLLVYFSEREICEIVYLVASEHLYNITNIALNIHSDMLCDTTEIRKNA